MPQVGKRACGLLAVLFGALRCTAIVCFIGAMIDRMAHPLRRGNKRLALHTCGMVVEAVVAAAVEVEVVVALRRPSYQTQTLSRDLWYVLPRVVGTVGRVLGVGYL